MEPGTARLVRRVSARHLPFFNARYYRPIGTTQYGCEWLDKAAIERFRRLEYRPRNLLGAYLGREAATPETLRELVGGMAWHLLQQLGTTRSTD